MGTEPLLEAVRRIVAGLGFELIEFRMSGPPQRPAIQVRIDRPESGPGQGITAEDCARTSRELEQVLEGPGGVGNLYTLEVSSPGIERPVRFPEHWRKYAGRVVRVKARSLKGRPLAVIADLPDQHHVRLRLADGTEAVVALDDIREALLQEEPAARSRPEP
jgi:ribosome maturation factor RimP